MKKIFRVELMGGMLALAGALLTNPAPALAQDYGAPANYNYAPAGQLDSLVSRIALYPDPLLAQIFSASVYPDQVAAAAQGAPGPFDPSVEALRQYPSVLQMLASDPNWTQALGQAVVQNQGAVMDAIQNLRQQAQQYGYLQSGPQMQVMNNGGYIDIEPVGGYMYVPTYDPYVVFASPRAGFFVGGAIRFGGGYHWAGGYNSFNWRNHEVFVNRQVWRAPAQRVEPRQFEQRGFAGNGRNFNGGNREWNSNGGVTRNFTAPAQPRGDFGRQFGQNAPAQQQRSFTPAQRPTEQRNFAPAQRPTEQRNFAPAQRSTEQRSFAAPRQMERGFSQPRNNPQPRGWETSSGVTRVTAAAGNSRGR